MLRPGTVRGARHAGPLGARRRVRRSQPRSGVLARVTVPILSAKQALW